MLVFPGGSVVKNRLLMQEMRVQSLSWRDPLEKEMATNSSILASGIHGQRSLEGCSPWGCKELDMTHDVATENMIVLYSQRLEILKMWLHFNSCCCINTSLV